ncbi:hypothetical protein O3P69_008802 [Scylla paramamosain]|uniref:Uncharacterized protein n=1 Tax=Scylla paramamosain TaxID=85552 RepID=A0AAW0TQ69_SCYPA
MDEASAQPRTDAPQFAAPHKLYMWNCLPECAGGYTAGGQTLYVITGALFPVSESLHTTEYLVCLHYTRSASLNNTLI